MKRRGRKRGSMRAREAWKKHKPARIKGLAEALGISTPAVSKWPYVPEARHVAVAAYLNVLAADLRPDLYDPWTI